MDGKEMIGKLTEWLRRRKHADAAWPTAGETKRLLTSVMRQLNSKVDWSQEKDDWVGRYTYQGGHFVVRVAKDSPYLSLGYLFFFEAPLGDVELVRIISNQANLNTQECRIIYSLDQQEGKVNVHLFASLALAEPTAKEMMQRAMANMFVWQNIFVKQFNEQKGSGSKDPEQQDAQLGREVTLMREEEMTHQDGGPDWHAAPERPMTLARLLDTAMGLDDIVPVRLTMAEAGEGQWHCQADDADQILQFDITATLVSEGQFARQATYGQLDFYDAANPVSLRHLTLATQQEGSTADTLYVRATMTLVPLSASKEKTSDADSLGARRTSSVIIGCDLTPSRQRLARFRYIRKEALAKQKSGNEDMTDDEKVIASFSNPDLARLIYEGQNLYMDCRYPEAVARLEDTVKAAQRQWDLSKKKMRELYLEVCYLTGECYSHMGQYEKAYYYLEMTMPLTRVKYAQAYINCMVNGHDFRAMSAIDGMLASVAMMQRAEEDEEDEDDDEDDGNHPSAFELKPFRSFLLRRKAYLLVEQKKYKEAEKLLKQLLDDPDSADFAVKELAALQKAKNGKNSIQLPK